MCRTSQNNFHKTWTGASKNIKKTIQKISKNGTGPYKFKLFSNMWSCGGLGLGSWFNHFAGRCWLRVQKDECQGRVKDDVSTDLFKTCGILLGLIDSITIMKSPTIHSLPYVLRRMFLWPQASPRLACRCTKEVISPFSLIKGLRFRVKKWQRLLVVCK